MNEVFLFLAEINAVPLEQRYRRDMSLRCLNKARLGGANEDRRWLGVATSTTR
jgi:hypothetical protein